MKYIKKVWDVIVKIFDGTYKREAVDLGLCDFSGQGRDKYGR